MPSFLNSIPKIVQIFFDFAIIRFIPHEWITAPVQFFRAWHGSRARFEF